MTKRLWESKITITLTLNAFAMGNSHEDATESISEALGYDPTNLHESCLFWDGGTFFYDPDSVACDIRGTDPTPSLRKPRDVGLDNGSGDDSENPTRDNNSVETPKPDNA